MGAKVSIGRAYVAGSAVLDLVAETVKFPQRGEQQLLTGVPEERLGGPGLAGAIAISRQFSDSSFVGCIGDDTYGQSIRTLTNMHAPSLMLPLGLQGQRTSYTWIVCDSQKERTFMHYPGANGSLDAALITGSIESAPHNSLLFIAGVGILKALEGVELHAALNNAKARGCVVAFSTQNPGDIPFGEGLERIRPALELADAVIFSNKDIESFLGVSESDASKAVEQALEAGAKNVLVTMGPAGAIVGYGPQSTKQSNWHKIEGYRVNAKDTTGCGDCAGAIFALKTWQGFNPVEAARHACAEGALVAERGKGAHGAPNSSELTKFLNSRSK